MTMLPKLTALPIGEDDLEVGGTRDVVFPFDGTVIATAPHGDAAAATMAVDTAVRVRVAVASWRTGVRRELLGAITSVVRANADALAELLVLESGKPLVDCRVEVARTLLTWSLAAEVPAQLHGETVPVDLLPGSEGLIGYFTRRPAGVVIGIAGFNYPLLLASHKLAPAIAAGCPIIVKPAPSTPLATLWLVQQIRDILAAIELPKSSVQLVTGDADTGAALTKDPRVAVVSFTGSAKVGHAIAKACAPRKALLELGSNAALIVAADADLDAAADAILRGGFYASGQACISVQRIIAVESIRRDLQDRVVARLPEVIVGDPRDSATRVSALITPTATAAVRGVVRAAVDAGATVLAGDPASTETVIGPTILADVPTDADAWREEIFAPVISVVGVADLDAAIALANDSRYGLHAAIFTTSLAAAHAAIDGLEVGGVVVNDVPGFRSDVMPYGGVKDSGLGREGPRWAAEEYTVTRMAVIRP